MSFGIPYIVLFLASLLLRWLDAVNFDNLDASFGMSGTFNSGTNLIAQLLIENCQITERMMAMGNQSKGIRWQGTQICID